MRPCCHFSRRQVLQWAGVVAATPFLIALDDTSQAYGLTRKVASNSVALPINLEVVTLTETTAILTWFTGDPLRPDNIGRFAPMPADTSVLLGTSQATLREVFRDNTPTPYHYVELTGLEPGQTYVCVARSGGLPAIPSVAFGGSPLGSSALQITPPPLVFTTPQPPPGKHLFSIALCNDVHIGENVAGLITSVGGVGLPPGIEQIDGRPPYAEVMATALARETRMRGADLLLVGGDLTSEASQVDTQHVRAFLDQFGVHGTDYFVTRGNHDRPHDNKPSAACDPSPKHGLYKDCFRDTFFTADNTWFAAQMFGLRMLGLDTYDTIGNGSFAGELGPRQFAFMREQLQTDRDRPTIVFGHHPVPLDSTLNAVPPVLYGLERSQANELEQLYKQNQGVFLHHAGHTHRNKKARSAVAPHVTFQEVAATKEYPGGFHMLRVHEGGYALNFYKFKDPLAQEWSERSRPEYLGLAPFYLFGNQADRNSMTVRDMSGLESAAAFRARAAEAAARNGLLPRTGPADDTVAAGVVAAATAAAAAWLRRKSAQPVGERYNNQ